MNRVELARAFGRLMNIDDKNMAAITINGPRGGKRKNNTRYWLTTLKGLFSGPSLKRNVT